MNIIIDKTKLVEALSKINASFSNKTNMFVSSSVLFEFLEKKIKVSATDLELSLSAEIAVSNTEKGSICVPFKKTFMLIKELDSPQVEIETEGSKMSIKCEKCEYNLNGFPKEKFPKISAPKDKIAIKLNTDVLADMIEKTRFCVFVGETNYVLGGVLLELENNEIRMVATDGKRLAFSRKKVPDFQPELNRKISVIVPLRAINEVRRLLQEEVVLIIGSSQIEFDIGNVQVISQLVGGEYPEYSKYIPSESKHKLTTDKDKLFSSLRRVSILTTADYPGIKIELGKNKLIVSKETPDLGNVREELDVEYSGSPMKFGFNPQYLMDVLKVLKNTVVSFDIYGPESPVVIRDEDYVYLALPMKLD